MTHYVKRQPRQDPRRDEIHRQRIQAVEHTISVINSRVDEALRHMFERGQVTPDTAVVTFTYDCTKRAIEVGGEHVREGSMVRVSKYGLLWSERWL